MILKCFVLCLLASVSLTSQSVRFNKAELSQAIKMAERENKNIFIDSYTNYCKPCKKMDIEFRNPELARYLNKHFINIKVDMELDYAIEYKNDYQIVFLPTLLFLNSRGDMRMSIDRLISAKDLLKMAKLINGESPPPVPQSALTQSSPPPHTPTAQSPSYTQSPPTGQTQSSTPKTTAPRASKTQPTTKAKDTAGAKILSVMDQDSDNWPPEVLRAEAYHRMQFMDGSHKAAAQKYLSSQKDWSTEDNMRFVHDFIDDARSEEFKFLIANRAQYETLLGSDIIAQSITILVNKELERAYPRPNKARVKQLLSYLYNDEKRINIKAKEYELTQLYEAQKKATFIKACDAYDMTLITEAQLLYRYTSEKITSNPSKKDLKRCLSLSEKATLMDPTNALYHYNAAVVALMLKEKKKALILAKRTIQLTEDPTLKNKVNALVARISEL